ncbi:hypothetical protein B0T26DRAFT_355099 [Lasiosphaeria miniovina]|uniref:Uncharacterized protein n=1 Tax=Lasiosphaeria miniovina TaxID=1954250 RepID=A0AA40ABY2_9PEZI|nr:uncharacterized protein B0T26DRAFT_355099 [Lasiosphaeria miniovina]KAK0713082.1 hypothetical protein B0T26DRAFT_355099 [Lasiosphaeria miniovina]
MCFTPTGVYLCAAAHACCMCCCIVLTSAANPNSFAPPQPPHHLSEPPNRQTRQLVTISGNGLNQSDDMLRHSSPPPRCPPARPENPNQLQSVICSVF